MSDPKVLALVMAGGAGSRLDVLTAERPKPAMPYAGVYRLIDFPLSNCMHSGIADVWLIEQYQPYSLDNHISNARPWDLDRTYGGLRLMGPHQGREESGWHRGNADAIWRHKDFIREWGAEVLVVVSSDHVYKLDYGRVIHEHLERSAGVTMVTTRVVGDDASRFGVVRGDRGGRISGYDYKPDSPRSDIVTTEVFVFDSGEVLDALEELASDVDEDTEDTSLDDFGDALLPRLVEAGRAFDHRLEGYWRDVGTVESYWRAHMDLLGDEPAIVLDDPRWPIHTLGVQRPPARVDLPARVEDSLISPGCVVKGAVSHSVLAPGSIVEEAAVVCDSIVLHDVVVESGASVHRAILDRGGRVGRDSLLGDDSHSSEVTAADDILVAGKGAHVGAGVRLEPGARLEAGSKVD